MGVVRREDDAGIRGEIEQKVRTVCTPADRSTLEVMVHDGVVELTGRMSQASMSRLVAEVEDIDDVVEVNNHLTAV
ncbi:BON domain-containing protein [Streptomyces sp. NPDC046931]|uniref:BON domain-containing protein n=1 Tax=Streptomyces sp. NPDC046931 TaxID=3154806 RepID=UPI0033E9049B